MSKPVKTMLTIIVCLTLIAVIAIIVLLNNDKSSSAERTIDDIVKFSFETEEITTDLSDGNYVKIQFRIVTDSKKALEYLQKGDFQLNNVIIKTLTLLKKEDFRSGLQQVEEKIKLELNKLLDEGLVTDVYITEKVLQ